MAGACRSSVRIRSAPAVTNRSASRRAEIGSRPAGSAAYDQAVQYVADELRQWGYQPTLQSFPVQTYDDRGSYLEVVGPGGSDATQPGGGAGGQRLEANTLTYSIAGTPEAPLVAAGLGQPSDLAGVDLHGKIALIERGTLRFSDKVRTAPSPRVWSPILPATTLPRRSRWCSSAWRPLTPSL